MNHTKLILISILLLAVTGCIATPRSYIFDENAPSMESLYRNSGVSKQKSTSMTESTYSTYGGRANYSTYSRGGDRANEQLFPELPNLKLDVYIFPHLRNNSPVPGYTTAIYLYDKAQNFALPGEVLR